MIVKFRELSNEVKQRVETSGVKDKAKGVSLTAAEIVSDGVTTLEHAVSKGKRKLEKKYAQNLKKVQSSKISKEEATHLVRELEKLATLRGTGMLTEEEFKLAKAKLLKRK